MNENVADAVHTAKTDLEKIIVEEMMQVMLGSGVRSTPEFRRALERLVNVRIIVEK